MQTTVRGGRTALAVTVLLIVTLAVPITFWGTQTSVAQQGPPSPSGTGPAVQLYNPSAYQPRPQMSDEPANQNGGDATREYHFTAAVTNPPPNPLVEFFLVKGNDPPFFLGTGTFTGQHGGAVELRRELPDAFTDEGPSPTPTNPDANLGDATVRAILYANNGANEVARDEQPVRVNQKDRDPDPQPQQTDPERAAETVEITYPLHGGEFGVFRRASGAPVGVVEVQWSEGTDRVHVYYSVSPPDVEPGWKRCGDESTPAQSDSPTTENARNGVRCTLVDNDQPEMITGVAAVAIDNEIAPGAGTSQPIANSGDGHRVRGYSQDPSSLIIVVPDKNGASAGDVDPNDCTGLIVATVRDDRGQPVTGVNVDVHARGPNDNLSFVTDSTDQHATDPGRSDPSKAPDNHPTEAGRDCDDTLDSANPQGVHAAGGGQPDRKHVESANQTQDDGDFVFQLWSDAAGATRVTAWAEDNDDDRFCQGETSGSEDVQWGVGGTALPAETPEPPPCPNPSPSPSGSSPSTTPTPTPTATPTASPTPTPTQTQTGTATPTPTPTPTPTGTQTGTATAPPTATPTPTAGTTGGTTPARSETETSLEASRSRQTFGKTVTLSGTVTSDNEACTTFADVAILRDVIGGEDAFEPFAETDTDENGAFTESIRADRSANYVAQVAETANCESSTSTAQPVLVRVRVSLRLSDDRVRPGQRVRITITSAPCPATARDRLLLFRAIEGQFGKSGDKRSNGDCAATFRRRIRSDTVFQGRWPKQAPEFLAGKSRSKAVRLTD